MFVVVALCWVFFCLHIVQHPLFPAERASTLVIDSLWVLMHLYGFAAGCKVTIETVSSFSESFAYTRRVLQASRLSLTGELSVLCTLFRVVNTMLPYRIFTVFITLSSILLELFFFAVRIDKYGCTNWEFHFKPQIPLHLSIYRFFNPL